MVGMGGLSPTLPTSVLWGALVLFPQHQSWYCRLAREQTLFFGHC